MLSAGPQVDRSRRSLRPINTFLTVFGEITWDIHGSKPFTSIEGMKNKVCPMYDKAYAALITELEERGMLEKTLVCKPCGIRPLPAERNFDEPLVFEVRPGESTMAYIVAERSEREGNEQEEKVHKGPIKFGNEGAGRNMPHGVKVDDIGLNGLMIPVEQTRQRFFISLLKRRLLSNRRPECSTSK